MEKERFFLLNNEGFIGEVYKRDNNQIVIINGEVDFDDKVDIFSNLTGKIVDEKLINSIVDCLKIYKGISVLCEEKI